MSLLRRLSGLGLAAIVMANGLSSASPAAKAEDLVDFLWGGSAEYGGSRSVVSFDPQFKPGQVIVSFSDRRLYWIIKPGVALTYPVAIPMGEARWQGVTSVTSKRVNPPWTPTPDMVRANPRLPSWVPGGHPMNPLGIRAMYLGSSAYRIHGTDAPWTIGQAVSHGCIRMTNEDVLDLYPRVPIGTRVTVTWQQFKTQTISDGSDIPRYTDRDSNPRAVAAPAPAQQSASAASTSSSSDSSAYSYRSYGAGKGQPARTVASQSNGGGLENLFAWAQGPKPEPQQSTPVTDDAQQSQQQDSRDATRDDDDSVANAANADRKDVAAAGDDADVKPFDKAPKKVHQATAAVEQSPPSSKAPSAEPKKKAASASSSVKKKPAATAAVATTPAKSSDPETDPTRAVPDPVKPPRETESVPTATHASATDAEVLPVQRASVQVQ